MKILWFTWKDLAHPEAGGAERVNEEIAWRLIRDGHEVIFIVSGFRGEKQNKINQKYQIIRLGNRYTVYWKAYRYYKKNLVGWADLVIDEMNTVPFFCKYYVKEPNVILAYQLCREIWFYQMVFPVNFIGYLAELIYLKLISDTIVLTESESTKNDLIRYGFSKEKIYIFPIGINIEPIENINSYKKLDKPTLLSLGAMRPMKRTLDQLKAFEIAKKSIPDLQLKIIGDSSNIYGKKVMTNVENSPFSHDIEYLGKINEVGKLELIRSSHLVLQTSVKEGWGLVVTESNSQGTPVVSYNVDGLRDSIKNGATGILTSKNNPKNLANHLVNLLNDKNGYKSMRFQGWLWSKKMTFENCYEKFFSILVSILENIDVQS